VDRVVPQREVRGEHRREMQLVGVERIRDGRLGVLRDPLVRARRALGELPLVPEQDVEEAHVPLGRGVGEGDLQPAAELVGPVSPLAVPTPRARPWSVVLAAHSTSSSPCLRVAYRYSPRAWPRSPFSASRPPCLHPIARASSASRSGGACAAPLCLSGFAAAI